MRAPVGVFVFLVQTLWVFLMNIIVGKAIVAFTFLLQSLLRSIVAINPHHRYKIKYFENPVDSFHKCFIMYERRTSFFCIFPLYLKTKG